MSSSVFYTNAQSRKNPKPTQAVESNGTFRVYAILKTISKGRMALDFGQKADGGYFNGQISDILLDSDGNDYKIINDHGYMKLLNHLSKLGWYPVGGLGSSVGSHIWENSPVLYKDVRNENELLEGLRFKKP